MSERETLPERASPAYRAAEVLTVRLRRLAVELAVGASEAQEERCRVGILKAWEDLQRAMRLLAG